MWLLTAGLCRWRFLAAAPLAPLPRRAPRPATLALPALSRLLPRARAARPAALVRSPSAPTALAPPAAPLAPLVPTSPLMPATTSAARELPCTAPCCTGSACIMVLVRCFTDAFVGAYVDMPWGGAAWGVIAVGSLVVSGQACMPGAYTTTSVVCEPDMLTLHALPGTQLPHWPRDQGCWHWRVGLHAVRGWLLCPHSQDCLLHGVRPCHLCRCHW